MQVCKEIETCSRKERNRRMRAANGFHRIVNANFGRKGLKKIKEVLKELDPDVLVACEPGVLGARPCVQNYKIIRYRSVAIFLKEKTTQIIHIRTVKWQKEEEREESKKDSGGVEAGKKERAVTFKEEVEWRRHGKTEKGKLQENHVLPDERIISVGVRMGEINWEVIAIYGPQKKDPRRSFFWKKLEETLSWKKKGDREHTLIVGDFNAIAEESETVGMTTAKALVVPVLRKWQEQDHFRDVWKMHSKGKGITRRKKKEEGKTEVAGSRIDRILATPSVFRVIKRSNIKVGKQVSDHAALVWDFNLVTKKDWGPVIAHENAQINWNRWDESVAKKWRDWTEEESRNRECRTKGKEESAPEVFKDFEIFCKKSYERIYEWIGNSGRQKRLKADCRRARKKKAEEWRKKIKEKMAEDEKKKILRKKKGVGHPELFAIMEDSGRWIEGEELEKTVAKQLRNFGFQKKCEEGWGEDREKMCKEEKELLEKLPERDELEEALRRMKKGKAVLKDDIAGWLIRQGGDKLKERVLQVLRAIWIDGGRIPESWARTCVRLIPKDGRDNRKLAGWRPIAIGTTMNKLTMMIWTRRLEKVALEKKWIHERQFGFIKGKTMKGVADLAGKRIDETRNVCVLQWDIEKAFPSIDPMAVLKMMGKLGVPEKFLNIYKIFYEKAMCEAIVAGVPGGKNHKCRWRQGWGLKQGCPASPLLLNLWLEPLVREMAKKTDFLQYADDMWAVTKEEEEEKVRRHLEEWVDKAGLKVCLEKEKKWTRMSCETLEILGMLVKEGKRDGVQGSVDKVVTNAITRGIDRGYRGWRRIKYINSMIIPRVRHKLAVFWDKKWKKETEEVDESLRIYAKMAEWPMFVENNFLYDEKIGLGLRQCSTEMAKDILMYVQGAKKQGEEIAALWKGEWERFRTIGDSRRIDTWKTAVEMLTDTEVTVTMYRKNRKDTPFPLGINGHKHSLKVKVRWNEPEKKVFQENNCQEAWESLTFQDAIRIWSDASVTEKGAAAAVLMEARSWEEEDKKGKRKEKKEEKREEEVEVYTFPTRGNAFRAEGMGILGAKRLLLDRGNREGKKEVHFLCDNKANIELARKWNSGKEEDLGYEFLRISRELDREILKKWEKIRYIHVKGHVGIQQNEICDERARNEVVRCKQQVGLEEGIFEIGEVTNKGMKIEKKTQLQTNATFLPKLQIEAMSVCDSHMAKRIQIGAETWKENELPFQKKVKKKCVWCKEIHDGNFYEMIVQCKKMMTFRKRVRERWNLGKGEEFDQELYFGRITKKWWSVAMSKIGIGRCRRKCKENLEWWEKEVRELREQLNREEEEERESESEEEEESLDEEEEESTEGEEEETEGSDEETEESQDESDSEKKGKKDQENLAKQIRKYDIGEVGRGEPEMIKIESRKTLNKKMLNCGKRE